MIRNQQLDDMTGDSLSQSWIIDTGASHHVCGYEACLMDVHNIVGCHVQMGIKHLPPRKMILNVMCNSLSLYVTIPAPIVELGRGLREKRPSVILNDYVTHTVQHLSLSQCSSYPLGSSGVEPRNFHEASQDEGWRAAMKQEIDALVENGAWVMEPLPSGKKALGCKWVYKIKH
ncbi:hypothetical protein LIER_42719 [Lithospermum erythrorhizon]|uniref:Uncharacterized protein n=1 Tax=Lithospermum erythrorhizon TaxID=34254 RepID=A0AAV3NTD8_LITER